MIEIISFHDRYHAAFRNLNLEWLTKYNLTESHDLLVLDHPRETILDNGGWIWLAKLDDEIVGTAALIPVETGIFELAKMSVSPECHGKGIGKRLLETCISKAKETGAVKLILFSNHQLNAAVKLYEKFGFKQVAVTGSPFVTADIKMELKLK